MAHFEHKEFCWAPQAENERWFSRLREPVDTRSIFSGPPLGYHGAPPFVSFQGSLGVLKRYRGCPSRH